MMCDRCEYGFVKRVPFQGLPHTNNGSAFFSEYASSLLGRRKPIRKILESLLTQHKIKILVRKVQFGRIAFLPRNACSCRLGLGLCTANLEHCWVYVHSKNLSGRTDHGRHLPGNTASATRKIQYALARLWVCQIN